jgi:hypothetical protein
MTSNDESGETLKALPQWLVIADGEGCGETFFANTDAEIVQILWDQCGHDYTGNEEHARNNWFAYLEDGDHWQSRDGYPRWRCDIEIGETGHVSIQRITSRHPEAAGAKWTKAQAVALLRVRDEFAKGKDGDPYHELYRIASPDFDKYEPWAELERIAEYVDPFAPAAAAPASPAEGCATCQGFRVINKGWQQEPCPDCAPSPVAGMSEAERSAITEALACADYYLVEASKRQATDHRAREMKQYATTLRQLSARLSGQGVGK